MATNKKKGAAKKSAAKKPAKKASKPAMKAKPAAKMKTAKASKPAAKAKKTAKATVKPASTKAPAKAASRAIVAPKLSNAAIEKMLSPLDDRIVVDVEAAATQTASGLFLPESNERPGRGTVIAKGPGKRLKKGMLRPLDVNVGDTVLFSPYSGTPVTLEGRDFLIMREEDVLGISE